MFSCQDIALIGSIKLIPLAANCLKEKNTEAWFNFVNCHSFSGKKNYVFVWVYMSFNLSFTKYTLSIYVLILLDIILLTNISHTTNSPLICLIQNQCLSLMLYNLLLTSMFLKSTDSKLHVRVDTTKIRCKTFLLSCYPKLNGQYLRWLVWQ